ncbi:MAG: M20/M25/M40 family metallo-hydrolase [Vicingaceae bacterium]
MKNIILFSIFGFLSVLIRAQSTDAEMIDKIFTTALERGQAYENLRSLCKDVGHRLTGSHGDTMAVLWGKERMQLMGYENVRLQEFETYHWTRGEGAKGRIIAGQEKIEVELLALGSSVGTGNKNVKAGVVQINSWEQLDELGEQVNGKIVFYNRRMDPKKINTFMAYGETVDQRSKGASMAAKYGAIAAIVRSVTLKDDEFPHTGNMSYSKDYPKIPGLAISGRGANLLQECLLKYPDVVFEFSSDCENRGMVKTNNVIGEIKGSEFPEEYIVVGGHLDSWDVGEGAHDDGAGIVHAMEVLNIFQQMGYKPKHSIRCVLFMNEENGVGGGRKYAEEAEKNAEKHIAAIESDAGGFSPRGFHIDAQENMLEGAYQKLLNWGDVLAPFNLHYFKKSYSGTDIRPLQKSGTVTFGLVPDSQRYFDFHHTAADVFEVVNKRELELGAASIASLVYLIDNHGIR